MALATKKVRVEEIVESVTLVLSPEEAAWLKRLTYQWSEGVMVSPTLGQGPALNGIHRALSEAGIKNAKDPSGAE